MIVLDTSVMVALVMNEPEAPQFRRRIQSGRASLSACNYVEASIVAEGRGSALGRSAFEAVVAGLQAEGMLLVALDPQMAEFAREGFRRYGKGRHPAGLNFGDCFAYALAKALDAPLLYKGDDFDKTDVRRA
jgi:ribonuclease VapC